MKAYMTLVLVVTVLAALLLSGCAAGAQASPAATLAATPAPSMAAEGRLAPVKGLDLSFVAGGRVQEVLVEEGKSAEAGQVLARLEGAEVFRAQQAAAALEQLQAEQALLHLQENAFVTLSETSAEVEAARKAYDGVVSGWQAGNAKYPSRFDADLKDYIDAEKDVRDAQVKVDDQRDQPEDAPARVQAEKRLTTEKDRRAKAYQSLLASFEKPREGTAEDKRTPLIQAVARLEYAQLRLDKLQGKADPEQEALLHARIESAKAAQAAAEQSLRTLELRAPWAGRLVTWDVKVGQPVAAGQVVGALADTSGWVVETTDLAENDVVLLSTGDPVTVTVNALPGERFSGTVEAIHGKGEKIQGDMTYQVRIKMDKNDPRWYWNLVVKVTKKQ